MSGADKPSGVLVFNHLLTYGRTRLGTGYVFGAAPSAALGLEK